VQDSVIEFYTVVQNIITCIRKLLLPVLIMYFYYKWLAYVSKVQSSCVLRY